MMLLTRCRLSLVAGASFALAPVCLEAQHEGHVMARADSARWTASTGAQAIALVTRMSPALEGRSITEGYVAQPMLSGMMVSPRGMLVMSAMLNFEGVTLQRGQFNPGMTGEGYADRRHPHTLFHEVTATLNRRSANAAASLTLGKGFASFGTDDPMVRGFAQFPANHHLEQILERAVVIGAVRWNQWTLEGSLFNGDEPTTPYDWPNSHHFFDSRATRLTFRLPSIEVQGSVASVISPENAFGGGLDQRKVSVSARYERNGSYGLAEWGLTDEITSGRRAFRFTTALAEGRTDLRGIIDVGARFEWTSRPEEERLFDPFRTPRPHNDNSNLGITRWAITTVNVTPGSAGWTRRQLVPFVEATLAHSSPVVAGALFDPAVHVFGDDDIFVLSAGVRFAVGMAHRRMGRYSAAAR